jgi:transcriptional regulator with XRE-family HTH domain
MSQELEGIIRDEGILASRLREAREYLGISQEEVARHLGLSRASISAIEAGKRRVQSLELREFARLYRTSVEFLLGDESEPDPVTEALFRTAKGLDEDDRKQVLRFAQFLQHAGKTPGEESS